MLTTADRAGSPHPRPGILDIAAYVPGGQRLAGTREPIRLASNESALGPSPVAVAAYRDAAAALHRYPDGGAEELRAALAAEHGVAVEQIVCGNGSDELIALLSRCYAGPGDDIVFSQYGFLMYRLSTLAVGARPVAAPERALTADVDALLAAVSARTRIVYLANPNNPTGTLLPAGEMERLRAGLPPSVLLVLDSAYAEYVDAPGYDPGTRLVAASIGRGDNVVMLRTFSKIYGLAGLRIGWAYCPAAVADALNRVRGPFNTNAPAQAAAVAALRDRAHRDAAKAHNDRWRPWLTERLRALGLEVPGSHGNFVLARFPAGPSRNAAAVDRRLQAAGIIARPMGMYGLPDCLRITVGLETEMQALDAALTRILAG